MTVGAGTMPSAADAETGTAYDVTVKLEELAAVPPGVVTVMPPLDAPAGTVARICVGDSTENAADLPLNRTALAPVKREPLIVTAVPGGPDVGDGSRPLPSSRRASATRFASAPSRA